MLVARFWLLYCSLSCALASFPVSPIGVLRRSRNASDRKTKRERLTGRSNEPATQYETYKISVPVDHFHNESIYEPHSDALFDLRYFFDAQFYEPGGPVIVLASGEDAATDRLSFLEKGLLHQLAKATNGIGVVLEHRYYGTSFPTSDLSAENLRFLTTQQALADTAYFAQNVEFAGLEHQALRAKDTPWIAYGGSYAGAFVAFLRTTYPDIFFGVIGSSAVTEAIYDFWAYYEPVRIHGPQPCIARTQVLTDVIDNILLHKNGVYMTAQLKQLFGLQDIVHDDDFANAISAGINGWQGQNWDPVINDPTFSEYCGNISANSTLYPFTDAQIKSVHRLISAAGYSHAGLQTPMLNYIGYINATVPRAAAEAGEKLDDYYTNHNTTFYALDSIDAGSWRSWPYQYCTQWGFLQTGSSTPPTHLRLISRLLTLDYQTLICRHAFNITTPANTSIINAYGGYNMSYDRLAFIDGEFDPWRGASPHAPHAPARKDTTQRPFVLIEGGIHHWDENGVDPGTSPPRAVMETQRREIEFVKAWLEEWVPRHATQPDRQNHGYGYGYGWWKGSLWLRLFGFDWI